jgi:hypothetical protein
VKSVLETMYSTFLTGWFLPYCACCMVSFLVYFDVRGTVVRWIVFMVVAALCLWLSYVYCGHLMCMCGLLMCTCCTDCIDVLL